MNKNKLKKKHPKHGVVKSKFRSNKNDSTEVFVLPPNLLQKLGINLANFGIHQESLSDAEHQPDFDKRCHNMTDTVAKEDISSARYNTQVIENDGTSFSQTASLMKESVFLSPTFVPTEGSLINGEIEIANVSQTFETNSLHIINKSKVIKANIAIGHISDNVSTESLKMSNTNQNLFNGNSGETSSICNIPWEIPETCTVSKHDECCHQINDIPDETYNGLTTTPISYQDTFINEKISCDMPYSIPEATAFENAASHNQSKNCTGSDSETSNNNKDRKKSLPNINLKYSQLQNKALDTEINICKSGNNVYHPGKKSCESFDPDKADSCHSNYRTQEPTVKSEVLNECSAISSYDLKKGREEAHSKSKISIICDQIIQDKSHLPKISIWKSPERGAFIPVTMNTLVSKDPESNRSECMKLNLDNSHSTNEDIYQRISREKPITSVINYDFKSIDKMEDSNVLLDTDMNKKHDFEADKSPIVSLLDTTERNNNDSQNCTKNVKEIYISNNNPDSCFENNLHFFADIVERHINTNKSYVDKYFNAKLSQQKDIFSGHDVLSGVNEETEIISNIFLAHNDNVKEGILTEDLEHESGVPLTKSKISILDSDSKPEVEESFNSLDKQSFRLRNNSINDSDNNLHLFVEIIEKHVENYLKNEAILQEFAKEATINNDNRGKQDLRLRLDSNCLDTDENLIRGPNETSNDNYQIFKEVNATHESSPLSDLSTDDSIGSHLSHEETNNDFDNTHDNDQSSANLFLSNFHDSSLSDYSVPIVIEMENEQRWEGKYGRDSTNDEIFNTPKQTTIKYLDKVNEIAACLTNHARLQTNRQTNENTCIYHNKLDEIDFPTNSKYKLDSKLCIQGVEEPGGSEKNQESPKKTRIQKTYQRRSLKNMNNQKPVIVEADKRNKITKSVPIDNSDLCDLEISVHNKSMLYEIFCICSDFGLMSYYDCENVFEHIHFGGKRATDCELNVLLSIYNEDNNAIDRNDDFDVFGCNEEINDISIITEQSICWKTIEVPHDADICKPLHSNVRSSIRTEAKSEELHVTLQGASNKKGLSLKSKEFVNSELCTDKEQSAALEERAGAIEKIDKNLNTKITNNLCSSGHNIENSNTAGDTMVLHVVEINPTIDDVNLSAAIEINSDGNENITGELKKLNTAKTMVVPCDGTQNCSIDNCGKSTTPAKEDQNRPESREEEESLIKANDPVNETIQNLNNAIQRILSGDSKSTASKETMSEKVKKRKKSSTKPDDANIGFDKGEPSSKKSVKCGVCSELLAADKWERHVAEQHCYVAWKAGENLSIYDDDLLLKLSRKVQDGETLKCTFCSVEIGKVEIFLVHLKKCLKEKGLILNIHIDICAMNPVVKDEPIELSDDEANTAKCGVCAENVEIPNWFDHSAKEHNHLAWKVGEASIDLEDQRSVRKHLQSVLKEYAKLACGQCGLNCKSVKSYLCHIKICGENVDSNDDQINESLNDCDSSVASIAPTENQNLVKCAVCFEEVSAQQWIYHMQVHNYLAWQDGDPPLNLDNEEEMRVHLCNILKKYGGLTCYKCGIVRKYAKIYQQHVKTCTKERTFNDTVSDTKDESMTKEKRIKNTRKSIEISADSEVKCALCEEKVTENKWINHIQSAHGYLSWKMGHEPLNIYDEDAIKAHLYDISKKIGLLTCYKCGRTQRRVGWYMRHAKTCNGQTVTEDDRNVNESIDDSMHGTNTDLEEGVPAEANNDAGDTVICGVCQEGVKSERWLRHIHKHDYLAWKEGETPIILDDESALSAHLRQISKKCGGLVCNKCGLSWKLVKRYLDHIRICGQNTSVNSTLDTTLDTSVLKSDNVTSEKCGVCQEEVPSNDWLRHIQVHYYLAWKDGETPLDFSNADQVRIHMLNILKEVGSFSCKKCCSKRKYVKSFLQHIRKCVDIKVSVFEEKVNDAVDPELDSTLNNTFDTSIVQNGIDSQDMVTCGVCKQEVKNNEWIQHTLNDHNYLAWKEGEEPLDITDDDRVFEHLTTLARKRGNLMCKKCGVTRKYVKSYLTHVETCETTEKQAGPKIFCETNYKPTSKGAVACAVCSEEMNSKDWKSHALEKHYNVAWKVGDDPIDLKNPYGVEKYLKEYKTIKKSLTCKVCKASRASCNGFYAHIITCGKTEEETECYKNWCQICESKYLCIYKNQHMAMHREQEYAKARKLKAVEDKAKKKYEVGITPGPRQAAERAKNVIGEYSYINEGEPYKKKYRKSGAAYSDSDESVQFEAYSGVESSDTEVDSDLSADEEQKLTATKKKKRKKDSAPVKVERIPFHVNHPNSYLRDGAENFHNLHYTQERLFPQWHSSEYHAVQDEEINKYTPSLEESCNVKHMSDGWKTYKRFEAEERHGYSLFAGGSIQCISWIPGRVDDSEDVCGNYLSVVSHLGPDSPRLQADQLSAHAGLIQIWDFGNFNMAPKLALGLAHDYGTIWAMDWCPSGARDSILDFSESSQICRLGLLAVACSNGYGYVFSVPYPNRIKKDDKMFYKLKPVVELRLSMNSERNKYQATALRWSTFKGHSLIVVGYGDGTTAYYNLNSDSALLKSEENGVTFLYPYHDERSHSSCVSGIDLYPGATQWDSLVSSASPVGCQLSCKTARLQSTVTASTANFLPYWPTLLASGDDHFMGLVVNEVDWWGTGRRFGPIRRACGCPCCGVMAAYMTPVLRLLRAHPAHTDLKKRPVGSLQMVPLVKKKKKQANDELSMVLEPLTYEDAIKEYGIELKLPTSKESMEKMDLLSRSAIQVSERFPLDEIPSMAFCPTFRNHNKLAVATHAGLVFIINV